MQKRILTDLTTEPVTLDEAKAHLVVDFTADDALITAKISAARQYLEEYTGLAFGEKEVQVRYDVLDTDYQLPVGPIIGDITIITRTINGEDTVLTTSDYHTVGFDFPTLVFYPTWTSCGRAAVQYTIVYQAGYNDDNPFPPLLKEALLKLVAELYRDRENSTTGSVGSSVSILPHHVRALASPFRQNVWL